jgi:hypothetical protein
VAAAVAIVAALALAGAACSRVDSLSFPTPPSTPATTTPTTLPDLTKVTVAAVAGQPATTTAIGPGAATLTGTVTGPNGSVGGADVHVERLVGDGVATADVVSAADGTWSLGGVLGGRYRVRAWRSPDLDLVTPQIFFVPDTGTRSVALQLDQFGGADVATALAPDPPVVGEPAGLAVQITVETVDATGVVRPRPMSGARAELANGLTWTVTGPNPTVTSAGGRATWQLSCDAVGTQPLAVIVNDAVAYAVNLSACVPPPPPTTTTLPAGGTPGSTTSTTGVTNGVTPGTTTSTSAPP